MRIQDEVFLAVTAWKENRGGGLPGMQSVMNVILNRAAKNNTNPYVECTRHLQFSSLTSKGDPELTLWPNDGDAQWAQALDLAAQAAAGALVDLTNGATLYYAPQSIETDKSYTLPNGESIPFPADWNPAVVSYLCTIQGQVFFR